MLLVHFPVDEINDFIRQSNGDLLAHCAMVPIWDAQRYQRVSLRDSSAAFRPRMVSPGWRCVTDRGRTAALGPWPASGLGRSLPAGTTVVRPGPLAFQCVDGCVHDVDNGGLTSLGQRLEPLGIWPADNERLIRRTSRLWPSGYGIAGFHGSMSSTPVSTKSWTLRVASSAFQLRQIAAICPSAILIWNPLRSRPATISA